MLYREEIFQKEYSIVQGREKNKKMASAHASVSRTLLILVALTSFLSSFTLIFNPDLIIIPAGLFIAFLIANLGLFFYIQGERPGFLMSYIL